MNLDRIYSYRFREVDQPSRQAVWAEIGAYLHQRLGKPTTLLDPAAGLGEFIASSPAAHRWAVDVVDHGLSSLEGVVVRIAPILEADLPEGAFDAVFTSNLLEHFATPSEIAVFLERMKRLMRPGGMIALMGPNFRYCAKEYFDCADHVLALTHVSAAEHLYGAGFDVQSITPRFLPYSFRSRFPASAVLTRAYLNAPAVWRLLGKQFLVLGSRPEGEGR